MKNLYCYALSRAGHNFVINNILNWANDLKYYNLENKDLYKNNIKSTNDYINLFITRDFLDWSASYIKMIINTYEKSLIYKQYFLPDNVYTIKEVTNRQIKLDYKKHIIISNDEDKTTFINNKMSYWLSYLKNNNIKIQVDLISLKRQSSLWFKYIQECFNKTNILDNKLFIKYEEFRDSKQYRQEICNNLNGSYNEWKLFNVPSYGSYSSFDGKKYINHGYKMSTSNRFLYFENDERYKDVYIDNLKSFLKNKSNYNLYNNYNVDKNKLYFLKTYNII